MTFILLLWKYRDKKYYRMFLSDRISFYILFIGIIFLFSMFIFATFGHNTTNEDSARYVISALLQGEAATLAIVLSLTLIAIQQISSSYSIRLMEVFKKSPDFWILSVFYIVSIFYQTWVLKQIQPSSELSLVSIIFPNMESRIVFSISLGIVSFSLLLPYTWNTIELLKPSTPIKILLDKISSNDFPSSTGINPFTRNLKSLAPFLPIYDIIIASIKNNDYATASFGISQLQLKVEEMYFDLFEKNHILYSDNFHFLLSYYEQIEKIGIIAINNNENDVIFDSIESLTTTYISFVEKGFAISHFNPMKQIMKIGVACSNKNLEYEVIHSVESLEKILSTLAGSKSNNSMKEITITVAAIQIIYESCLANGQFAPCRKVGDILNSHLNYNYDYMYI
ncbi:hypothetical protein [Methanolobus profundi]|nr:hypothetical protein [Methanolobus profundi]